jgi:hypothetical protein
MNHYINGSLIIQPSEIIHTTASFLRETCEEAQPTVHFLATESKNSCYRPEAIIARY